ncbi:hypothetical protein JMUB5695_03110 [Mycobacterium heckeshornense]|uniref:hypothetical protein n=1 Tax=Mycobacterium heckeshornense TaxID=110505 RepID=UPI00194327A2|nr:hypothetical protein [Mycobacterium heckeshornense]BCQ09660.1 hypothetical protein JMUB5695_03110 [Mycobacterium heckeshornense]
MRVFAAAQLQTPQPVAVYRGLAAPGHMEPICGELGTHSAALKRFRAKGFQVSYLAASFYPTLVQDDLAVACGGCGGKFSVPVAVIFGDLRVMQKRGAVLPTRRSVAGDSSQRS